MEQAFLIRELVVRYVKRYETVITAVLKFIVGAVIFTHISGLDRSISMLERLASRADSVPYIALMSLIFAVTPINAGYLLITFNLVLQTSAMLEVAIILGVFLLAVQGLYTRLAPVECPLILVMLAAYYFKLPYLVPIAAGMYFSLTGFIPIAIATFIWQFMPVVINMFTAGSNTELSVSGLTAVYQTAYSQILGAVTGNHDWVIISFVYAMVVIIVYILARAPFSYAREIAIGVGGLMSIIGFTIVVLAGGVDIELPGMIFSVIFSTAIAFGIRFFDVLLDYEKVERVQFQDEHNMYYVKIVPKIELMPKERAGIKRAAGISPPVRTEQTPEGMRSEQA